MFIESNHLLQDILVEDTADGGEAHEDGGFDVVDYLGEGLELLAFVVGAGEVDFVLG